MIISKAKMEKIREIIEKQHRYLLVAMLGKETAPKAMREELAKLGMEPKEVKAFLELAYHHNYVNDYRDVSSPKSHEEMRSQQTAKELLPKGTSNQTSIGYLESNIRNYIQKQSAEVTARVESIIQSGNNDVKFASGTDSSKSSILANMLSNSAKSKMKTAFRDYSKEATRNWDRIVNTEVSNAVSLGSADRIVEMNADTSPEEIFVYRIVTEDAALCKYCRKFYQDHDGSPKVYRLATILANGSNFGKKSGDWKPVAMATHPNERCSPLIQLKAGWRVLPGGGQAFMGPANWAEYIRSKVVA